MHQIIGIASWFVLLAPFVLLSVNITTAAENFDAQSKALNIIGDFAERMCTTVPLKGDDKKFELTGNAKAELNGLVKRLANLGFDGAAKYQTSEWQGVLQQDVAGQLNNSRNCKLEIFKDLKGKFLGKDSESSKPDLNTLEGRRQFYTLHDESVDKLPPEQKLQFRTRQSLWWLQQVGLKVSDLKRSLNNIGYYRRAVNDNFDPELIDAIILFQKDYSLRPVDGICGEICLGKLRELTTAAAGQRPGR